jgi:HlyD family secretion protein
MKKKTRNIIIVIVVALVVVACVVLLLIRRANTNASTSYQTEAVAKGELTALVGATGSVRANQSATLSWQTTGRIASIDVAVGDMVKARDVLASLATDSLGQSVILAQADLVTAQRNLQNLNDSKASAAQAQLNLANAQKNLTDAKNHVLNAKWQRGSQDQIDNAEAQVTLAQQQVDAAQQEYDAVAGLPVDNPSNVYAQSQLAAAEKTLNTAKANLNWLAGNWDNTEVAINDAKLAVAQAAYDDAVREWNRIKNGPDPEDIKAAQARVDALLATLGTTSLKTPIAGTVTEIDSMIGDQVSMGTPSFRIDDLSHMVVDVQVLEVDITRIKVGQDVTINFDALQGKDYHGKVTEVAWAGDIVQGVVNFKVTIEITDSDAQVLPAMTAAVNIIVEQISDVILIPNRAIRNNNGVMAVYVLRNNTAVPIEITLGASSDSQSQLLSGDVTVGDLIILNPPTTSLLQQGQSGMGGGMGGILR